MYQNKRRFPRKWLVPIDNDLGFKIRVGNLEITTGKSAFFPNVSF